MLDNEVVLEHDTLQKVYTKLVGALNEVQIQQIQVPTYLYCGMENLTTLVLVKWKLVLLWWNMMTLNFFDWSLNNSSAYFWLCDDILKCSMLKLAIEWALEKSPHYVLAHKLFDEDHGILKHQLVGFESSYSEKNVLTAFHLESFVTFYTDSVFNTLVTCSLTTRHHILSNMQDWLLQLLQLMQFLKTGSFSLNLTNIVLGSEVMINQDSINGYMGFGFDMSHFNEDGLDDVNTFGTCKPIRIVQYRDSYTWSKYPQRVFPINFLNDFSERMISEMNNFDALFRQTWLCPKPKASKDYSN